MSERAWLDVSVFRCPECGRYYVDASWYAVELRADIECGDCHKVFNTKRQLLDRVMLRFDIGEKGKTFGVEIVEHIPLSEDESSVWPFFLLTPNFVVFFGQNLEGNGQPFSPFNLSVLSRLHSFRG